MGAKRLLAGFTLGAHRPQVGRCARSRLPHPRSSWQARGHARPPSQHGLRHGPRGSHGGTKAPLRGALTLDRNLMPPKQTREARRRTATPLAALADLPRHLQHSLTCGTPSTPSRVKPASRRLAPIQATSPSVEEPDGEAGFGDAAALPGAAAQRGVASCVAQ